MAYVRRNEKKLKHSPQTHLADNYSCHDEKKLKRELYNFVDLLVASRRKETKTTGSVRT